jgi:endonuclease-8
MRIVLGTPRMLAVAFNVPIAEFHTPRSLARRRGFDRLGPAVLAKDFDAELAVANLQSRPDLGIGAALLDQSLLAGVGNVFKSEICFVAGVHPFRLVGTLTRPRLDEVVAAARRLMLQNVTEDSGTHIVTVPGMRHTTRRDDPDQHLWVYQRKNQPCRRCGAPIEAEKDRYDARATFWCPVCQPMSHQPMTDQPLSS